MIIVPTPNNPAFISFGLTEDPKYVDSPSLEPSRFSLLKKVGEGSSAVVYKAFDHQLDQIVALKVLRSDESAPIDKAIQTEVHLARNVLHRNMVRVFDLHTQGTDRFISMEYVEGPSLKEVLAEAKHVNTADTIRIFKDLCKALIAAHSAGIVHCDVKPSNVIVSADRTVLSDLGCASLTSSLDSHPRPGALLYMSPEQIAGESLDGRTDVYSLGLVIFEMLTGKRSVSDKRVAATSLCELNAVTTRDPRACDETIPEWLAGIVIGCIEENKARRFQTVDELLEHVEAGPGSETPCVPPASSRARITTPWGRMLGKTWIYTPVITGILFGSLYTAREFGWFARVGRGSRRPVAVVLLHFDLRAASPRVAQLWEAMEDIIYEALTDQADVVVWRPDRNTQIGNTMPVLRQAAVLVEGKVSGDSNIIAALTLRDPATAKVLSSFEIDGSSLDWLGFGNHLLRRLLTELLVTRLHLSRPALPPIITDVPDAFLLYCKAQPFTYSDATDDLQRAADLLGEAVSRDPAMVRAYARLALVKARRYSINHDPKDLIEAQNAAESGERLKPNDISIQLASIYVYLADNRIPQALHLLAALETRAPRLAPARVAEGLAMIAQGANKRAVDALQTATELNPLSATAFVELGGCYSGLSDYSEAIGAFTVALQLDGDNQDALLNVGDAYIRSGDAIRAIPSLQRALQLRPEAITYAALALGYLYSGNVNISIPLLEKAAALGGETDIYVGYLGQAYQFIGDSRADRTMIRAIMAVQAAARRQPTDAQVYGRLALYLARMGRLHAAEESIRKATEEAPTDLDIMYWQAIVQALGHRDSEATATLGRLAERGLTLIFSRANPDGPLFHRLAGFEALRLKYHAE